MPLKKKHPKEGLCPYCINGTLAYDEYSGLIFCVYCEYAIKVPVISFTAKKGTIIEKIPNLVEKSN